MQSERFPFFILIILSLLSGYLVYLIISPFLNALMWGIVLAILFYPLHVCIQRKLKWRSVSSLLTLLIVMIFLIGPVSYLVISLGDELGSFLSGFSGQEIRSFFESISKYKPVAWILGLAGDGFSAENIEQYISSSGKAIVSFVGAGVKNVVSAFIDIVIMLFSFYFLLIDGPVFLEWIKGNLPFPEKQKEGLVKRVRDMVISTIYGGVAVAVCQGLIGGIAYLFLGVGSPVLWGSLTALMSFVPMIGTFAVWGPIAGYFFLYGEVTKGIIMVLVGVLVIAMIDNVLKPLIIGGRTKMHTLIIFFSVLGGIKQFGLIGLIMGPLVVVFFLSVIEIFRSAEARGQDTT